MPSSPSHRAKRPYQPSITKFFSPSSPTDTIGQTPASPLLISHTQWPAPRPLAPLPAQVQSSLMNVGMRIRKAVPEGYKTHSSDSIHKPLLSSKQSTKNTPSTYAARQRELVPFCAINNIGNLETENQVSSVSLRDEDLPDLLFPGDDDFDTPFSSQESRTSTTNALRDMKMTTLTTDIKGGRKRTWEDPEEGDHRHDDLGFKPGDFSGQLLSSNPINQSSAVSIRLRPLAQPRSKRKAAAVMWQGAAEGQKAAAKSAGESRAENFEEEDVFQESWLGEEMEF